MALNKQRILSELGSVVNQLQSADCGCMGKLFSDPGQGSAADAPPMQPYGGCRMGCCHGQGSYSGETCPSMNNQFMHRPMMGNCNPPRLYADTYNYLNKNLMQPLVNEVYNDLKTISPNNTIMNNPMASKMGLSSTNPAMTGQPGQGDMGGMAQTQMTSESMGNPNLGGNMSGMSPGYNVNMRMGNTNASPQMGQQNQYMGQIGQPMDQMGQPMDQMGQPMDQMGQPMGQITQPMGGGMNQQMGQMGQSMGQMDQQTGQMGQPMGQANQPMNQMGGMGAQIMKMMMGDKVSKPANMPVQNGQLTDSMLINAPQSPHGQVGVTPLNPPSYGASAATHSMNYEQDNAGAYAQNPTSQHMTQANTFAGNPMARQAMFQNNMQKNPSNNMNSNVRNQPMVSGGQPMAGNRYGHHTEGMKKFSEMFPGVMQGDLGFDPMAIAIQMNPANQQQAAINTMQKLMNGDKIMNPATSSVMQPVINAANAASASVAQSGAPPNQQSGDPSTPVANRQVMQNQMTLQNQPPPVQQQQQQQQPQQQQLIDPNTPINQVPQQQVYSATGAPVQYQQSPNQQYQQQLPNQQYQQQPPNQQYQQQPPNQQYQQQPQQYQTQQQYQSQPQTQQQVIDPNTGAVTNLPNLRSGYNQDPNANMQQGSPQAEAFKEMIMEPIFPADTKNGAFYSHHVKRPRNYYYNTLGQPIQMIDSKRYHLKEPPLPQTLSPQPTASKPRNVPQTFSNVKNTISRTSLIGNGTVGRTPSRNQLQHLYNQYKGSQSFTQQNINAPVQHHSHSEGRLNENLNAAKPRAVPVEKFGGDTIANNVVVNQEMNKPEQLAAVPMGDVPADKPQGDGLALKASPMTMFKGRNGLQDMVYTSSPTSAAWSFHGDNQMPYSTGYRFRSRAR